MTLIGSKLLELQPRQQKIIEAVEKMQKGFNLFEEGKLEFIALCGESKVRDVTNHVKEMARQTMTKKTIAAKRVRKPKLLAPADQELADEIIKHISKNPWTTRDDMRVALRRDYYRVRGVLDQLLENKEIKIVFKINPNHRNYNTRNLARPYFELA